jgi:hypothetical protein
VKTRLLGFLVVALLACAVLACLTAADALAAVGGPVWRQRQNYRAPAVAAQPQARNTQLYSNQNSRPSGSNGWNASNTWYNVPSYGNYAPPPYATSRSAFYQVGPVPALGGVRSLSGWGGAR